MKTCRILALASLFVVAFGTTATAQDEAAAVNYTPNHKWELGLHAGYGVLIGDYDSDAGFGAGFHIRRAIDHVFSVRIDGQYLTLNNSTTGIAGNPLRPLESTATTIGGSIQAVMSLNNLKFNDRVRNWNLYVFAGPGASLIDIEGDGADINAARDLEDIAPNFVGGGGFAYRVNEKFNIGLEHKVIIPFGKSADLYDGFNNNLSTGTSFRDIPNYTNLRFNFNIGKGDDLVEPLYWVNPLNQVIDDLTELKARPVLDLTDTDADGIIDMLDQEDDTPEGAPVDTRGVALDSDGDGVKDFEDGEPYSPPGMTYDSRGVAQMPDFMTRPEVDELISGKLRDYEMSEKGKGTLADWFLPIIHFDSDSYSIRAADYGHLKNVAAVLRSNPTVRIVVQGYADQQGGDDYNRVLSYNRARSAKEYLVNRYGISPDRLVIKYDGEENNLVPTSSGSFMNRRVEFSVADAGATSMGEPSGPRAGKGTFFSGSRDAGY